MLEDGYVGVDRLGRRRWTGDSQGHVTKFPYYPYGEEYTTTAQDRDKFGTYYRDGSTGLDYARNRYYASALVRRPVGPKTFWVRLQWLIAGYSRNKLLI